LLLEQISTTADVKLLMIANYERYSQVVDALIDAGVDLNQLRPSDEAMPL